jgi:hypothetical protein
MPDRPPRDDAPTLAALAALAFIVADVAHEVIGHGAAYLALGGGWSFTMTTTRWIDRGAHVDSAGRMFVGVEHGELYGRIFSLGGPLGGLLFAALAALALRGLPRAGIRPRLFLWLTLAFNLFWSVGYLIYSGALGLGDWAEAVRGLLPAAVWRLGLLAAGIVLYDLSMRALARGLGHILPVNGEGNPGRVRRLLWISYAAAGVIACVAALFDPRGADQIYISGAPSAFVANLGLLALPGLLRRYPPAGEVTGAPIARSLGWLLAALLVAALFVGFLGPGIRVSL